MKGVEGKYQTYVEDSNNLKKEFHEKIKLINLNVFLEYYSNVTDRYNPIKWAKIIISQDTFFIGHISYI